MRIANKNYINSGVYDNSYKDLLRQRDEPQYGTFQLIFLVHRSCHGNLNAMRLSLFTYQ